jgi:hypothetical protein
MPDVLCRCTDEDCDHEDEECGKPVTVKLKASVMIGPDRFGPEFETGICEECWKRLRGKYGFGQ